MSEKDSQADSQKPPRSDSEGGSVFGNLPRERPGSRSPRRGTGAKQTASSPKAKAAKGKAKRPAPPKAKQAAAAKAAPPKPKAPPAPSSAPEPLPPPREPLPPPGRGNQPMRREGQEPIGGLEDLAWAGVTVAAQAATAGVKLASRALDAVRKSVERP